MTDREVYTVEVACLTRHFPLFEVAPGVRIATFSDGDGDWSHIKALANLPLFAD